MTIEIALLISGVSVAFGIYQGVCNLRRNNKTDEQIEVSEEIYNQLTRLPADYSLGANGNITNVISAPEPEPEVQPPTMEERLSALEDALLMLI